MTLNFSVKKYTNKNKHNYTMTNQTCIRKKKNTKHCNCSVFLFTLKMNFVSFLRTTCPAFTFSVSSFAMWFNLILQYHVEAIFTRTWIWLASAHMSNMWLCSCEKRFFFTWFLKNLDNNWWNHTSSMWRFTSITMQQPLEDPFCCLGNSYYVWWWFEEAPSVL